MKLRKHIRVFDNGRGAYAVRYAVVGPAGAVELHGQIYPPDHPVVLINNQYDGCDIRLQNGNYFEAHGFEYHGRAPLYEGQSQSQPHCHLLGAPCYHDGSSLQALRFARAVGILRKDIIFAELISRYEEEWYV